MFEMDPQHIEYIALALFVASELIGMNPKMRSNSLLQLVLAAAMRAFPYAPKQRKDAGPLDKIFSAKGKDRR